MRTIDYMNECTVRDLVLMLMEERGLSLHEALDTVYNSETYAKLMKSETGLYFQSPVYTLGAVTNRDLRFCHTLLFPTLNDDI